MLLPPSFNTNTNPPHTCSVFVRCEPSTSRQRASLSPIPTTADESLTTMGRGSRVIERLRKTFQELTRKRMCITIEYGKLFKTRRWRVNSCAEQEENFLYQHVHNH